MLRNFPKNMIEGYNPDTYEVRLNQPVYRRSYDGDIGLEIEVEGNGFQSCMYAHRDGYQWVMHNDQSLRGDGAREYILNFPCAVSAVPDMVHELFNHFQRTGANPRESNRTSVHVHLNAQGLKINELCSWMVIWGILEDVLVNYCGPYRVGNLFCLRIRDCDWAVDKMVEMFQTGQPAVFRDNARYLAMNPHSLNKFQSLEFRSMRGTFDPDVINDWVDILWRLKTFALTFKNPEDIPGAFSGDGPYGFLERAIGDRHTREVLHANRDDNAERLIWGGMRRVQPVIYSMPWSKLMPEIDSIPIHNPFPKKKKSSGMFLDEMPQPIFVGGGNAARWPDEPEPMFDEG